MNFTRLSGVADEDKKKDLGFGYMSVTLKLILDILKLHMSAKK